MSQSPQISNVVIVGGGTAGWISAALLVKMLGKVLNIKLVESEQIGTIGVGEATIPPMVSFNNALGIREADFLKATQGTIKLGIEFENWGEVGDSYMHAFGGIGKNFPFCDFHHFWLKHRQSNPESDYWQFSPNYQAAKNNQYAPLANLHGTQMPGLTHAYHFDAGLYAKYLRQVAESMGVKRIEGKVAQVNQDINSGDITSLQLEDGQLITGDLFIDCSGMRGLLIEKALHVGFEDWSHWLPCNSAIAMPSDKLSPLPPYTRSIAHEAGWRWQIPLQHRTGNGIVYSSDYLSQQDALDKLLTDIDGEPLNEPNVISFKTGRRRKSWHKNVVSIGLSSGFLEPLESTSIHLIQTAIIRLIKMFPHNGIQAQTVCEFNRQGQQEIEHIRDFIILHYKLNTREEPFWRHCQQMDIPDSLRNKIELFKSSGNVFREQDELFTEIAWQQVMIGQGLMPNDHHPLVDSLSNDQLNELFANLATIVNKSIAPLPSHEDFIRKACGIN
ncbi:tryptophan halogenase family protein [Thalassotalea fusca]